MTETTNNVINLTAETMNALERGLCGNTYKLLPVFADGSFENETGIEPIAILKRDMGYGQLIGEGCSERYYIFFVRLTNQHDKDGHRLYQDFQTQKKFWIEREYTAMYSYTTIVEAEPVDKETF